MSAPHQTVDAELQGWKEHQIDYDKIPQGLTTVHVQVFEG